jgi:dimethylhistidine N-methyltransferase
MQRADRAYSEVQTGEIKFAEEILHGFRQEPKRIPSKYFYDVRGAELFEEICTLEEYYPTRTEIGILEKHLAEMAQQIGPHARIIEFGSGEGIKTKLLIEHLDRPSVYIPIDISREQLEVTASILRQAHPGLEVLPLAQDYTAPIELPKASSAFNRTVVFFPGSTLGNFERKEAADFLRMIAGLIRETGKLLIGVDLVKDRSTLERAYNDSKGVTAEFNLHLIERLRDELETVIEPTDFAHYAFFNEAESRIEMHLIAKRAFEVIIAGHQISIREAEHIITEFSHKFTLASFEALAARAGLRIEHVWQDEKKYFAEILLGTVGD